MNIKELVGTTIVGIGVDRDGHNMVLDTDKGQCILSAVGDCCSETWFSDFLGVDTILGQRVSKVEEIELPNYNVDDGRGRQEHDEVYGYRFTTQRGYADLVFRNSSNGYYGGELFQGLVRPRDLTPIYADWKW